MGRRALARWAGAAALATISSCSLFVSLSDLQGGESPGATDGQAGTDGSSDAGMEAATSDGSCPQGGGPPMIALAYGYCIDSTEVTQSQYAAFVAAVAAGYSPPTPPRCEFNPAYSLPTDSWCNTGPDFPVACANWCDAYAFCQWAGKHLCGAVDGGALPSVDASVDPGQSSWEKACSENGANLYSYGGTYEPVCNEPLSDGGGFDLDATTVVGSNPMCQGPPGVYDLIGNASEWIDACDEGDAGANDNCAHLGGAAHDRNTKNCFGRDWDSRHFQEQVGYAIGFRCCSP